MKRTGRGFAFGSIIYCGYDYPPDGIGNHLGLLDRLVFDDRSVRHKSLCALPFHIRGGFRPYGKVPAFAHFANPDAFKGALFLDVARDMWSRTAISEQIQRVREYKQAYCAVTALYLMWESDRLWAPVVDLVRAYDFCIVTSHVLDEQLAAEGVDAVHLRHPYDYALKRPGTTERRRGRPLTFGVSAGLWARKNVALLAEIFAETFGDDPRYRLKIHTRTDPNHRDHREEFARIQDCISRSSNISIRAKRLTRAEYLRWLNGVDVYCFVSSGEGYSVTPREALHLGIPTILLDAHAHRDFSHLPGVIRVAPGERIKAEPNTKIAADVGRDWGVDRASLAAALRRAAATYPELRTRVEKGHDRIATHHDPGKIKRQWMRTINRKYREYAARVSLLDSPILRAEIAGASGLRADRLPAVYAPDHARMLAKTGIMSEGRRLCVASMHQPAHCLYGPYLRIDKDATLKATFSLEVFRVFDDERPVATFDVHDENTDTVIGIRHLGGGRLLGAHSVEIDFHARKGQLLDFRAYWYGTADVAVDGIRLEKGQGPRVVASGNTARVAISMPWQVPDGPKEDAS